MPANFDPPENVDAVVQNGNDVLVSWDPPGGPGPQSILLVDDDGSAYLEFTDTQPYYDAFFTSMGIEYDLIDITVDAGDGPTAAEWLLYLVIWNVVSNGLQVVH